jgi:hypothetical protein
LIAGASGAGVGVLGNILMSCRSSDR